MALGLRLSESSIQGPPRVLGQAWESWGPVPCAVEEKLRLHLLRVKVSGGEDTVGERG